MTHDLLLLLLLFIYIFVNFCTAHLSETEADHGSKGEKARERGRETVCLFSSSFFCTFSLTFCFLAQKLVDELMSFY